MIFPGAGGIQVKVCGITRPADAIACAAAGADALGFNFFSGSSRHLDPAGAIPWIKDLGDHAARVAVVVNPSEALLDTLREAACFEWIQFHGDETPEFCAKAGFGKWIKAVRVKGEAPPESAFDPRAGAILLDAWNPATYGGTGERLDWALARAIVGTHASKKFLLAGGLSPENVGEAVAAVRPHAVDAASGIESSPGIKNESLVRAFVSAAKSA